MNVLDKPLLKRLEWAIEHYENYEITGDSICFTDCRQVKHDGQWWTNESWMTFRWFHRHAVYMSGGSVTRDPLGVVVAEGKMGFGNRNFYHGVSALDEVVREAGLA